MQDQVLSEETSELLQPRPGVNPVVRFLKEEDGAVLLEYVTLLINVFIWVTLTAAPLQEALMGFAENVFEHLHLP